MLLLQDLGSNLPRHNEEQVAWIENKGLEVEPVPVSGTFPQIGYTPAEALTDEMEVPAFLRRSQTRMMA